MRRRRQWLRRSEVTDARSLRRLCAQLCGALLAQVSADVIVIVDLSQEANSLTILALGINEMFLFCYLTNFILDVMTDRENRFS